MSAMVCTETHLKRNTTINSPIWYFVKTLTLCQLWLFDIFYIAQKCRNWKFTFTEHRYYWHWKAWKGWIKGNVDGMVVVALDFFQSLKSSGDTPKFFWWGCVAPIFGGIPLAKENLVQNIPLAKSISWSWAHFYVNLRNFSPNIPLVWKQTTILPQYANF